MDILSSFFIESYLIQVHFVKSPDVSEFSSYPLSLIFSLILLWVQNTLCMIFSLWNLIKAYFMTQNVVCLGEYSMWIWRENVFFCCLIKYHININLNLVKWWYISTLCLLIFYLVILSITNRGVLMSPAIIMDLSIFLVVLLVFVLSTLMLCFKCLHVKDCYVFWENWSLYHYAMPLSLPFCLVLKSAFSEFKKLLSFLFLDIIIMSFSIFLLWIYLCFIFKVGFL